MKLFGKSCELEVEVLSQEDIQGLLRQRGRRTLGAGGSCTVLLVQYKGEDCCFKQANKNQDISFLFEGKVLRRLKGADGAPRLLGVTDEDARHMGLLTTFCGHNTFQQLSRVANTDADKLHAFTDLCHGLRKVHARGYVHNDIKNNNVVVRRDPADGRVHVSLIDYGLARRKGVPLLSYHVPKYARKAWMAPEVYSCLPCRPSMDVYSLGHLLKEVLQECKGSYPRLEDVAERATARFPRDRPSVKYIANALERCLNPNAPPPPRPSFKARLRSFFSSVRKAFTTH